MIADVIDRCGVAIEEGGVEKPFPSYLARALENEAAGLSVSFTHRVKGEPEPAKTNPIDACNFCNRNGWLLDPR